MKKGIYFADNDTDSDIVQWPLNIPEPGLYNVVFKKFKKGIYKFESIEKVDVPSEEDIRKALSPKGKK